MSLRLVGRVTGDDIKRMTAPRVEEYRRRREPEVLSWRTVWLWAVFCCSVWALLIAVLVWLQ